MKNVLRISILVNITFVLGLLLTYAPAFLLLVISFRTLSFERSVNQARTSRNEYCIIDQSRQFFIVELFETQNL